jgi:hypothetical protein
MTVIVERIQHEFDKIIVEDVFAPRQPGAYLLWFAVKTNEDRVQVFGVVSEIDLGTLGNRCAVAGYSLPELICPCQFVFPGWAGFHRQKFFNGWGRADARDANLSEGGIVGKQGSAGAHQRQGEPSEVFVYEHAVIRPESAI